MRLLICCKCNKSNITPNSVIECPNCGNKKENDITFGPIY